MVNMSEVRTYARGGSYGVLALFGVGVVTNFPGATGDTANFFLCLLYTFLLAMLEVPFVCTCMDVCRRISMKLSIFENYLLRGALYAAVGVLGFFVADTSVNVITIALLALVVDGCLYLVGYLKGEKGDQEVRGGSCSRCAPVARRISRCPCTSSA
jgi:hypothetical protein